MNPKLLEAAVKRLVSEAASESDELFHLQSHADHMRDHVCRGLVRHVEIIAGPDAGDPPIETVIAGIMMLARIVDPLRCDIASAVAAEMLVRYVPRLAELEQRVAFLEEQLVEVRSTAPVSLS